jgi:hypothetical protein
VTVSPLTFTDVGSGEDIAVRPGRLVIAGYTARDQDAVRAHIDELEEIGVAPPPQVPMFYEIPATLATTAPVITVDGTRTSGEVEPVVVRRGGRLYLGLGSDHTDREVEMRDIAESKASAPKPVGTQVVPLDRAAAVWDGIDIVCRLDGDLYQQGKLAAMLTADELLERLSVAGRGLDADALMFCGTLPLLTGSFVYGTSYELALRLPDGAELTHTYDVKRKGERCAAEPTTRLL